MTLTATYFAGLLPALAVNALLFLTYKSTRPLPAAIYVIHLGELLLLLLYPEVIKEAQTESWLLFAWMIALALATYGTAGFLVLDALRYRGQR